MNLLKIALCFLFFSSVANWKIGKIIRIGGEMGERVRRILYFIANDFGLVSLLFCSDGVYMCLWLVVPSFNGIHLLFERMICLFFRRLSDHYIRFGYCCVVSSSLYFRCTNLYIPITHTLRLLT